MTILPNLPPTKCEKNLTRWWFAFKERLFWLIMLESPVLRPIKTAEPDRTKPIRTGLVVLVLLFRQIKTDENWSFRTGCDWFEPVLVGSHVALILS